MSQDVLTRKKDIDSCFLNEINVKIGHATSYPEDTQNREIGV